MKTLLVFLLVLLVVAAAIARDAHRLGAAGWFSAVVAAGLFAVAHRDTGPGRRRPSRARRISAARAEQKICVLCAAGAS